MLRKITVILLMVLLVGIFAINVSAALEQSKLQTILDRGHLIVGTGSANVPWHFMNEEGELVGMDIDMARILAIGLFDDPTKVEFVIQAPDARIPSLLTDKVDIVIQFMTMNAQRAQQVAFSVPYYVETGGAVLPANGKYKSFKEMEAAIERGETVKIAVLQNVFAAEMVQNILKGAKDDQYESPGLLFQAIDSGRADAASADMSTISWFVSREPEKYLYLDKGVEVNQQNYGAAMRPDDQIWINFVNLVFQEAMCGVNYKLYYDAYAEWFGEELPPPKGGKPVMFRD